VLRIINESHAEARRLLAAHRKQLDALAQALVARETLSEQEILEVTGLSPAPPLDSGISRPDPGRRADTAPAAGESGAYNTYKKPGV
jgi:cell division protease FtsH